MSPLDDALTSAVGDTVGYLRVLRGAPLLVPHRGGLPLRALIDGRAQLPAFTSGEALERRMPGIADGYRTTDHDRLMAVWPDPALRLAVNPGGPSAASVGVDATVTFGSAFAPDNPYERLMFLARERGRGDLFLDALVTCRVEVPTAIPATVADLGRPTFPWLVDLRAADPVIHLFTSPVLRDAAGYPGHRTVSADLVDVLRAWPSPGIQLGVDAGSALATLYDGAEVPRLLEWAARLAVSHWPG